MNRTVQRRIQEIAKKTTGPALRRAYLAEDYDGIGSAVALKMSQGSSSAAYASVAAGAFGTEQFVPADTQVMVLEQHGKLEVVSLGTKTKAITGTSELLTQSNEETGSPVQDASGTAVITPEGFSGAWAELIADGLYNSRFITGELGDLPAGRTSALPYWTVSYDGTGNATLVADSTWSGGNKIQIKLPVLATDSFYLESDPVPVSAGQAYAFSIAYEAVLAAGGFNIFGEINWYDSSGVRAQPFDSSGLLLDLTFTGSTGKANRYSDAAVAPANATYATLKLTLWPYSAVNVANYFDLASVTMKQVPYELNPSANLYAGYLKAKKLAFDGAIQSGEDSVTGDGVNYYKSGTVTFPAEYSAAPIVVGTIHVSNTFFCLAIGGITTTGFTYYVYRRDAAAFSSTVPIQWMSLGEVLA